MNVLYAYVTAMVFLFILITLAVNYTAITFGTCIAFMFLATCVIYANHTQHYRRALWLHFFLSGSPALIFSIFFGFDAGFYLYVLAAPISILLFVDIRNKRDLYGASVYYVLIFLAAAAARFFGYEMKFAAIPSIYLLIINFAFTAIFICVLGLTFVRLNESFFDSLKASNLVLAEQRNEIAEANAHLVEKNEEISDLAGVLNDKVKNNLQIIALFTELDMLNLPTKDVNNLLLLQKSRVKVLDLCYALIFEQKALPETWFDVVVTNYYGFLKQHYALQISENANFDLIIPTNTPAINRKKFEMVLLMLNEWHFSWIALLNKPTEIDLVFTLMVTEDAAQPFYLTIKVGGHPTKSFIPNHKIQQLRQTTIQIKTRYDAEKDMHVLVARF